MADQRLFPENQLEDEFKKRWNIDLDELAEQGGMQDAIKQMADVIYPDHDPAFIQRLANGILVRLKNRLKTKTFTREMVDRMPDNKKDLYVMMENCVYDAVENKMPVNDCVGRIFLMVSFFLDTMNPNTIASMIAMATENADPQELSDTVIEQGKEFTMPDPSEPKSIKAKVTKKAVSKKTATKKTATKKSKKK
jgi:hypothetical protein